MKKHTSAYLIPTKSFLVFCLPIFIMSFLYIGQMAYAISIGEEYNVGSNFAEGTLVGIKGEDTSIIEKSNLNNDGYIIGVTQNTESNLVTISKDYADTPVAISGEVSILASDINGDIKQGELLSASWIDGVAMKMRENSNSRIVGIALEDFDSEITRVYSNIEIPNNLRKDARVGFIKIRISAGEAYAVQNSSLNIGGFLEDLTGKDISDFRLAAGFIIFIASLVVASVFIYSSIKGSFISFGRNPLASNSIYGGLLQVSTISVTVLAVGATLAYVVWAL